MCNRMSHLRKVVLRNVIKKRKPRKGLFPQIQIISMKNILIVTLLFLTSGLFTFGSSLGKDSLRRIKHREKIVVVQNTNVADVFNYMDRIGNTGEHMTKKSMAMMGGKLKLTQLTENVTGVNSKYRWTGKTMGFKMDFTVITTQWEKDHNKVLETTGPAKMIILDWYRMKLVVDQAGEDTRANLSIDYTKPRKFFFRSVGFFLAKPYANWCLEKMLYDTRDHFQEIASKQPSAIVKIK